MSLIAFITFQLTSNFPCFSQTQDLDGDGCPADSNPCGSCDARNGSVCNCTNQGDGGGNGICYVSTVKTPAAPDLGFPVSTCCKKIDGRGEKVCGVGGRTPCGLCEVADVKKKCNCNPLTQNDKDSICMEYETNFTDSYGRKVKKYFCCKNPFTGD